MTEQWRPIPQFSGYEVSDLGRVRSLDRIVERIHQNGTIVRQPVKGRVLSPASCKNGYLYVNLAGKHIQVHRLVAIAFVDGYCDGLDVSHKNNNRHDNRCVNLSWKTRKDNIADQLIHGTRRRGEKHPCAKLTEENVIQMREMRTTGASWRQIGEAFGVFPMTAKNAIVGNTWGFIESSKAAHGPRFEEGR